MLLIGVRRKFKPITIPIIPFSKMCSFLCRSPTVFWMFWITNSWFTFCANYSTVKFKVTRNMQMMDDTKEKILMKTNKISVSTVVKALFIWFSFSFIAIYVIHSTIILELCIKRNLIHYKSAAIIMIIDNDAIDMFFTHIFFCSTLCDVYFAFCPHFQLKVNFPYLK